MEKAFNNINDIWEFSYDFFEAIKRGIAAESTDSVTFTARELFAAIVATIPVRIGRGERIPPFADDNGAVRLRSLYYADNIHKHAFLFEAKTEKGYVKVPVKLPEKKRFTFDEAIAYIREQVKALPCGREKEALRIGDILENQKTRVNLYQESRNAR